MRWLLPMLVVAIAVAALLGGVDGLLHALFAAGAMLLVAQTFARVFGERVPFTSPPVKVNSDSVASGFLSMFLAGIAGGVHFVVARYLPAAVWVLIPVMFGLSFWLLRRQRFAARLIRIDR